MNSKSLPDSRIGDTLIDVKKGTEAVRTVRTWLMERAYDLIKADPRRKWLLLLADPKITNERLADEWKNALRALKPELMDRMSLVLFHEDHFRGFPADPDPAITTELKNIIRSEADHGAEHTYRGTAYYELLKILIYQWLLNKGPVTTTWLTNTAGLSYPTVAAAIKRLGKTIRRHNDRRIELAHFPREEWAELVAVSDRARSTIRFADRSGQPRSPDSLLRRLQHSAPPNLAVGGVLGAKHYDQNLDLIGIPRLDLTVHSTGRREDLAFVHHLDPALQSVEDPTTPANLVIHFIRRHDSLFDKGPDRLSWADPVECLLDLTEARLEPQALEFVKSFAPAKGQQF